MEQLLIYLLKVNGLLIFFWIFYKLLLQKETFYTFNRFYFLGTILMSFVFPLIYFTKIKKVIDPISNIQNAENNSNILKQTTEIIELKWYVTIDWLMVIAILITVISIVKICIRIFKIVQLTSSIQKLEKHPTDKNIRITKNETHVYSFYKWIILPNKLLNSENLSFLIQHEKVHIQQKHTFDLVSLTFISDFFWFNPIIKWIRKDVNLNLEFIVDDEITKQENSYLYQKTLLNFNQNETQNILTNAFTSSDLKQRILMLNTQKSKNMKKLKIALTAPVLLAFFGLFQIETVAQVKNESAKTENQENVFGDNQLILETLQKDIKSIQENKKLFNEIVEKYKITVDGKEISKQELKNFDNSKIKSVAVDLSSAKKGTQVDFATTGQEDIRSFKFGILSSEEAKIYLDDKPTFDSTNKSFDKILIDGKESSIEEWQLFFKQNTPFTSEIENRILVVNSIKKENDTPQNNTRITIKGNLPENILYLVDGEEISSEDFKKIYPDDIEAINVLKDKELIKLYGDKAKNGVIVIQLKEKKS